MTKARLLQLRDAARDRSASFKIIHKAKPGGCYYVELEAHELRGLIRIALKGKDSEPAEGDER